MRWKSITAYALAASKCDASTASTSPRTMLGTSFGLASLQVLPPSRVTLIRLLFVPTQIKPVPIVDAEMDSIAPPGGAFVPGAVGGVGAPLRTPRSPLSAIQ